MKVLRFFFWLSLVTTALNGCLAILDGNWSRALDAYPWIALYGVILFPSWRAFLSDAFPLEAK